MEQRVCRRCLLKELDGAYFQSVYEYIKSIPEEEKTDPAKKRQHCAQSEKIW